MDARREIEIATHEEGFLNGFIGKVHRDRLRLELQSRDIPKRRIARRARFLQRFSHAALKYLDPRFITTLKPPNSDPVEIQRLLEGRGAEPTCYAISSEESIDGRILPLGDALEAAVGYGMPTILSCLPRRLAYLETEQEVGPPDRFILFRSA